MRPLTLILILAAFALGACGDSDDGGDGAAELEATGALPREAGLLFVLRGEGSVDQDTIEVRTGTVEWFTDRPKRRAGIAPAGQLVDNWAGFGFDEVPPNTAVLGGDAEAAVALSKPEATANGLAFEYVLINGRLPASAEQQLSLFVDDSSIVGNPQRGSGGFFFGNGGDGGSGGSGTTAGG